MDLEKTCVIRFGALGDLCICGWFVSALAEARPDTRITLVTKPDYLPLAKAFRGVDDVLAPRSGSPTDLIRFASTLRDRDFSRVFDAHAVLRSTLLWIAWRRLPDARLRKDTLPRLMLIAARRLGVARDLPGLGRRLLDRFMDLDPTLPDPDLPARDHAPLAGLRPDPASAGTIIGLAPGARWPVKTWPAEKFGELCEDLLRTTSATIEIFLGPRERAMFSGHPLSRLSESEPRVRLCRDLPLPEVAARLAACRCLVTNDSGLLHLAEAAGTPVVAVFGPTTRAFGYAPLLPDSRTVEIDLPCRPCSRTGSRDCHRGDRACLEDLPTASVREAMAGILAGSGDGER